MSNRHEFEYIGKPYKSNCLLEAVKAKLRNPKKVTIYFCPPRITENGNFQWCHFLWSDTLHSFDFSDDEASELPWYKTIWYEGKIRMFDGDFARHYAKYRRSTGKMIFLNVKKRKNQ